MIPGLPSLSPSIPPSSLPPSSPPSLPSFFTSFLFSPDLPPSFFPSYLYLSFSLSLRESFERARDQLEYTVFLSDYKVHSIPPYIRKKRINFFKFKNKVMKLDLDTHFAKHRDKYNLVLNWWVKNRSNSKVHEIGA